MTKKTEATKPKGEVQKSEAIKVGKPKAKAEPTTAASAKSKVSEKSSDRKRKAEESTTSNSKPKISASLDDIFGNLKQLKAEKELKKKEEEKEAERMRKIRKSIAEEKKAAAKRPTTDDGLPIFTEDELNINKGGDTDLCPFDCDCCF